MARLLLLALLLAAGPAAAEFYGSFGLGWNYADTLSLSESDGRIDYDFGLPAGSLAVGMRRGQWRLELEASHQENEPEILYFRGSDSTVDSLENDRLAATSVLFNVYRDFRVGAGFRPYLGAGIGPAQVALRFRDAGTEEILIDDEQWTAALQGIVGVEIPLTRQLALGLDYRYWYAPDFSLEDSNGNKQDLSQGIHSGWLRAQYRFGGQDDLIAAHPVPDQRGFTLTGTFGGGWAVDEDISSSTQLDAFSIGPMAAFAVGYSLSRRWQLALELARRNNDMQIIDFGFQGSEARTLGEVRADSLILNLNYRFRPSKAVSPYAGLGLGAHRTRYDLTFAADGSELVNDTATGGVLQWWLGFEFAIDRRWTAMADFRMWIGQDSEFELSDGTEVESRHVVQGMTFGLRYAL